MPPHRRQSFAPTSSAAANRPGLGRKRAASFVPGEAARQLAPRKSILKSTPFTFSAEPSPEDEESGTQQFRNPFSRAGSEIGLETATVDYRAEVSDNTSRKSLGLSRRVSFAPLAQYRVFESNDNTNSTNGPESSPVASPAVQQEGQSSSPIVHPPPRLSNENDYPGRRVSAASSLRMSFGTDYGERSMSLDMDDSDENSEPPTDPVFFQVSDNGSGEIAPPATDEDFGEGEGTSEADEEDGEMEITEAIAINIDRKKSLSIAQQHALARRSSLASIASGRKSSIKFASEPSVASDEESVANEDSQAEVEEDRSQPQDFTIALEQPLKPPKPPSQAWLALKAMANGSTDDKNDDEDEGEDMELTSALTRLQKARASYDIVPQYNDDDDFGSSDSSMNDSGEIADQTLNVTSLMGRVSNMELSGEYSEKNTQDEEDFARPIPLKSTAPLNITGKENMPWKENRPGKENAPPTSSGIFFPQPPTPSNNASRPSLTPAKINQPSTLRPPAPSIFSAPSPSPSRIPRPASPSKAQKSPAQPSPPEKRPASESSNDNPAKKRRLEPPSPPAQPQTLNSPSPSPSPERMQQNEAPKPPVAAPRTSLGSMRRPPGYFAARRSLSMEPTTSLSQSLSLPALNKARSVSPAVTGDENQNLSRRASIAIPSSTHQPSTDASLLAPRIPLATKSIAPARVLEPPEVVITPESDAGDGDNMDTMQVEASETGIASRSWRPPATSMDPEAMDDPDDGPAISIDDFFTMTGVKFHEHTVPRRSTIHPSQLNGGRESNIQSSMADFLKASIIHIPQHELYHFVIRDLQVFIDNIKRIYIEAEDEVSKVTPILFKEFAQADEEGREQLLHELKLIKANRHCAARESWYDIRSRWTQNLLEAVEQGHAKLEKDIVSLDDFLQPMQELLPDLREEADQVLRELAQEEAAIEEVEQSDPDYLNDLKASLEEINAQIDVFKKEEAESSSKLERLDAKISDLEAQKSENLKAITMADQRITLNKNSTPAEVYRLEQEIECIQALHSWRVTKIEQRKIALLYKDRISVIVPCDNKRTTMPGIVVSKVEPIANNTLKTKRDRLDPFPLLSDYVLSRAQAIAQSLPSMSLQELVATFSDFFTSCTQVRTQFTFLKIKFPLQLEVLHPPPSSPSIFPGIKVTVPVLIHAHKAKVSVSFLLSSEVLDRWPFSLPKLDCEVRTVYGVFNAAEMRSAVMERLAEATVEDNHACILDSCVEAVSRFS